MGIFRNAILLFDGPQRSAWWDDADLACFAAKLKKHYVKFVRNAPDWFDPLVKPPVPRPFLKSKSDPDKFDLDQPNPKYDEALARYRKFLNRAGVEVWFDLFDNCAQGRSWSPWKRDKNVQGINGIYQYDDKSLGYYKAWVKRIFDICGKRSHYGLGNELYYPAWANPVEANKWGEKWALGIADYLRGLGARYPLSFSANNEPHGTASRIIGWLTEQGGYGGRYGERLIYMIHGMGLPEHFAKVWESGTLSSNVGLGVDEDGVGMNDAIIPPEKQGSCEIEPDIRCGVNRPWFVRMVKSAYNTKGVGRRLRCVCRMPKELAMSYQPLSALREARTLGVFNDLEKLG